MRRSLLLWPMIICFFFLFLSKLLKNRLDKMQKWSWGVRLVRTGSSLLLVMSLGESDGYSTADDDNDGHDS